MEFKPQSLRIKQTLRPERSDDTNPSKLQSLFNYKTIAQLIAALAVVLIIYQQNARINASETRLRNLESHLQKLYQLQGLEFPCGDPCGGNGSNQREAINDEPHSQERKTAERRSDSDEDDNNDEGRKVMGDANDVETSLLSRVRRQSDNTTVTPRKQNRRKKQSSNILVLHMFASRHMVMAGLEETHIDRYFKGDDVLVHAGTINKNDGFMPTDGPLKIWDHERWPRIRYERFADISRTGSTGEVTIKRNGLYLIYVQVTFQTPALHQSVRLSKKEPGEKRQQTISRCLISERFSPASVTESSPVYLLCPITTTTYIRKNTTIFIESVYAGRRIMLRQDLTYWGIIALN